MDFVELTTVFVTHSRALAEVVAARLRAHGMEATIQADDTAGLGPNLALDQGVHVKIPAHQAQNAAEILESDTSDSL